MRSTAMVVIISALTVGASWGAIAAITFGDRGSILSYSYGGTP